MSIASLLRVCRLCLLLACLLAALGACSLAPAPMATSLPTATTTPSATATPSATSTPTSTPTATATRTPTLTPTVTATSTQSPSATATVIPRLLVYLIQHPIYQDDLADSRNMPPRVVWQSLEVDYFAKKGSWLVSPIDGVAVVVENSKTYSINVWNDRVGYIVLVKVVKDGADVLGLVKRYEDAKQSGGSLVVKRGEELVKVGDSINGSIVNLPLNVLMRLLTCANMPFCKDTDKPLDIRDMQYWRDGKMDFPEKPAVGSQN